MINALVYATFICTFFLDFLHFNMNVIPRSLTWGPDLLSIVICFVVAVRLSQKENIYIEPKYLYLILFYVLLLVLGILVNRTPMDLVVFGVRVHLKHLPLFLLAAVYALSENDLKKHLKFIFCLLLIQTPVSLYQRLVVFRGSLTGDDITGTVSASANVTLLMVSSIAVVFALYLRKNFTYRLFVLTALWLFIPTTINETKVTIFLVPIALFMPVVFNKSHMKSKKIKDLIIMASCGVLLMGVFIPVYNYFLKPDKKMARKVVAGPSVIDFLTDPKELDTYLFNPYIDEGKYIRRGLAVILTYKILSSHSAGLPFGLGVGNSTRSYFRAANAEEKKRHLIADAHSLSYLTLEMGLVGFGIFLAFFYFLFKDAVFLSRFPGIFGSFALGWTAVIAIFFVILFYLNILLEHTVNFPFWYFSGVVAAKACQLRRSAMHYRIP